MTRNSRGSLDSSSPERLTQLRRQLTSVFLSGVGLGSTGLMAAFITAPLAAEEISGRAAWSGLPSSLSILGTAAGTTFLASLMERHGRRLGLIVGYNLAAIGAIVATGAVLRGSFALLVLAMFVIGLGRSGDALSRYLVADLYPVERRASAIGWMVWVGTIGAVLGPNAIGPAGRFVVWLGLPRLSGAFVVTTLAYAFVVLLYTLLLRPDPSTLVADRDSIARPHERVALSTLFHAPGVRIALAILVIGQTAMVLIMTMTPVYLRLAGHDLVGVGLVMSSHIVGMYVFSPLTGRLVDAWGRLPVIVLAQLTILIAALAALIAPAARIGAVALALFLLGLGWNLGYVAGSALLSSGLPIALRTRLQGATDTLVWSAAAIASAVSGVILATLGYDSLCLLAALLLVVPGAALMRYRRALLAPGRDHAG